MNLIPTSIFRKVIMTTCLHLLFSLASYAAAKPKEKLVLGTWPDYMAPEIIEAFEKEHNAIVIQNYFNSEDDREEQMVRFGSSYFDATIVSGYMIPLFIKMNWVKAIKHEDIPNIANISPFWAENYPEQSQYGVPYFWGTSGIAYREDLVLSPPESWLDLLNPAPEHRGNVRMIDDSVDLVTIALRSLATEQVNKASLAKIRKLLLEQKPHVSSYEYISLDETSSLISGDDHLAFIYNGDALLLQELDPRIKFSQPKEGSPRWIDFWVIMKNGRNNELAQKFINFINIPKWAAINAEYVNYATPNKEAFKLTSESYQNNKVIYNNGNTPSAYTPYVHLLPLMKREVNSITSEILH